MASGNNKIVIHNLSAVCSQHFGFRHIGSTGCNNVAIGEIISMVEHRPLRKGWLNHSPQVCPWNLKIFLPGFNYTQSEVDNHVHGKLYTTINKALYNTTSIQSSTQYPVTNTSNQKHTSRPQN